MNDMVGWKRRGAPPRGVAAVTDQALKLLARPFGDGETVIVKPSNLVNSLAMMMLAMYPNAKAVLLYAPIESFLISIAKKEMWGRKWVRELLAGIRQDGYLVGGLNSDELLQLTDLQIAALGWLSQHSLFAHIANKLGSERIKVLDSKTLLGNQHQAIQALTQHFDIALSPGQLTDILKGPAFNSHSKFGQKSDSATFNAVDREKEQSAMADLHGEEIKMVADWTRAVAASQNIKMDFGSKILG